MKNINLRRVFTIITLLASIFNLTQAQTTNKFKIIGQLQKETNGKIFLIYRLNSSNKIDSAIVKNGAFTIEGHINDPVFATLSFNPILYPKTGGTQHTDFQNFFLEGTTYKIDSKDSVKRAIITGGKAQSDYLKHGAAFSTLSGKYNRLVNQMGQYKKDGNDTAATRIGEELTLIQKEKEVIDSIFIKKNPDSYVAFTLWKNKQRGIIDPPLEKEFLHFTKEVRTTIEGSRIGGSIAKAKALSPGNLAPDFTLPKPDGSMTSLSKYRGKNVLLVFWFKNFGSFNDFAFNLNRLNRMLKDKNTVLLGIYYNLMPGETKDTWIKTIEEQSFNWENVADIDGIRNDKHGDSAVASSYDLGPDKMPQGFLIGPDGKIIARHLVLKDRELYADIQKMLK